MRSRNRASGFSLLEIIVVLAIAGSALVAYTNYARKQASKEMRLNIANALVHEMNGVMNFLRDGTLQTKDGEKPNPFYESVISPSEAHYHYRITNGVTDIDTGTATQYFLWGDGTNPQKQQRYYFISKGCKVTLKSTYELTNEYLPCSLMSSASNPAAKIERIGFATDDLQKQSNTVDRMDAIVAFNFTQGDDKYRFANYVSPFNNALNNAGLIASHIMIVHRRTTADAWKLVTKADGSTPIEFADIASNLERLEKIGNGQQLGIRFIFEMKDNDSGGSGGGGSKCWSTTKSKIELCYNQEAGTGMHGEDQILSLDMLDKDNQDDGTRTGTLKANLVMENTGRPVYIFKRSYGGDLQLSANGEPERFTYKDANGEAFEGEFYLDDNTGHRAWDGNTMSGADVTSEYYIPEVYDAFELVTPSVTEYSGFEKESVDITNVQNFVPDYNEDSHSGTHRFYVQSCPKIKQDIILRDAKGNALLNSEGKQQTVSVERVLYPHLSASLSSVSAYSGGGKTDMYTTENDTRHNISDRDKLDLLGGVTIQVELAEQEMAHGGEDGQHNPGRKLIYPNAKYVWVVTATMGMYDSESGLGVNIENPQSISYTITKWCSTIPQSGTPYDLLSTTTYK